MKRMIENKRPGGRTAAAVLAALLLASGPVPAPAAKIYPSAGTTSASFLKVAAGARAAAMAGAYTSLSDDAYAVYWNPAGLALPVGRSLAFTHNQYFQGLNQEFLGYTVPGEKLKLLRGRALADGHLGIGVNYFYTPKDLERRSGLYESDPLAPVSPVEGRFGAYDLAVSVAYGYNYSRDLRLGGAVKLIRQSIDTYAGNTAALDFGLLYDFSWLDRPFTAGFSVQNFGPGLKLVSRSFDLPLIARAGVSHRFYDRGLLVAVDLSKPVDNYPSLSVGLEQPVGRRLFLRAGYSARQYGNELGAFSGLAGGMGFVNNGLTFDYSFSPFGDLGSAHRISLGFRFQPPAAPAPVRPTGAEPAEQRLEGAVAAQYSVVKKALRISSLGVDFSVEAISAGSALSRIGFRSRRRTAGEFGVEVFEGNLPPALAAKLPSGYKPVAAWQFGQGFSGISGDLELGFTFAEGRADPKAAWLLYLTESGWRKMNFERSDCAGGICSFPARVPLSTHYVFVTK